MAVVIGRVHAKTSVIEVNWSLDRHRSIDIWKYLDKHTAFEYLYVHKSN